MAENAHFPLSSEINAASIQLPSPWPANMVAWFHGVEAQFHCREITQELTMYFHVLRTLPEPMMQKLGKFLACPLSCTPYTDLKIELLKLTTLFDKQRYAAVSRDVEFGESKPSDLLSRLEALIPNRSSTDSYFRQLWLEKLPSTVQSILAAVPSTSSMTELAAFADKVDEAQYLQPTITKVSLPPRPMPSPTSGTLAGELHALRLEVKELRNEVRDIKARPRDRTRSVSSSRFRSRPRYVEASNRLCFYHTNFGAHAKKCQQPCYWVRNHPARE